MLGNGCYQDRVRPEEAEGQPGHSCVLSGFCRSLQVCTHTHPAEASPRLGLSAWIWLVRTLDKVGTVLSLPDNNPTCQPTLLMYVEAL